MHRSHQERPSFFSAITWKGDRKLVALRMAAEMLKVWGRVFLLDIVFPSEATDMEDRINAWIRLVCEQLGPELAAEAETQHLRRVQHV
ncbi:MAG: hypothetical protein EF813_07950 [Methanosarcinales archaeon]|nr:MAG: hypothetical protein EF813_07950 [Methanosarcinales archaeon]